MNITEFKNKWMYKQSATVENSLPPTTDDGSRPYLAPQQSASAQQSVQAATARVRKALQNIGLAQEPMPKQATYGMLKQSANPAPFIRQDLKKLPSWLTHLITAGTVAGSYEFDKYVNSPEQIAKSELKNRESELASSERSLRFNNYINRAYGRIIDAQKKAQEWTRGAKSKNEQARSELTAARDAAHVNVEATDYDIKRNRIIRAAIQSGLSGDAAEQMANDTMRTYLKQEDPRNKYIQKEEPFIPMQYTPPPAQEPMAVPTVPERPSIDYSSTPKLPDVEI